MTHVIPQLPLSTTTSIPQKLLQQNEHKEQSPNNPNQTIVDIDPFHDKNDWQIFVDPFDKVSVCSFIRLFMIRRILMQYFSDNINNNMAQNEILEEKKMLIQNLSYGKHVLNNVDIAKLLFRFLTEDGIQHFLDRYNELAYKFSSCIETIFNEIILTNFKKEYQALITYSPNKDADNICNETKIDIEDINNGSKRNVSVITECTDLEISKSAVFNTDDLMSNIFQYLTYGYHFDQDLYYCSLVNSHWLYHVWNINSVYFVNLSKLINQTLKYDENDYSDHDSEMEMIDVKIKIKARRVGRTWQRFINAKSIYFYLYKEPIPNSLLLKRLSAFANIEKIYADCTENHVSILKILMQNCAQKIKYFDVQINLKPKKSKRNKNRHKKQPDIDTVIKKENVLSPLKLINANCITIHNLYFYIIWSVKCRVLMLEQIQNISENWCKFVINYCDCSGIEYLKLYGKTFAFDNKKFKNKISKRLLLEKLASKFTNLKRLSIYFYRECDSCVLLFWQLLKPIIEKNNGIVELGIHRMFSGAQFGQLNEIIDKSKLKITKLNISIQMSLDEDEKEWELTQFEQIKKLLCHPYLQHLKLSTGKDTQLKLFIDFINDNNNNDNSFKHLKIIQINNIGYSKISAINNFLQSNMLFEKRLFVIAHFRVFDVDKNDLESNFQVFWDNITHLLIKKQVPIDIAIRCAKRIVSQIINSDQIFNPINLFHSTKQKLLKEYKPPKCNQFCVPVMTPQILLFEQALENVFHVSNVERSRISW